MQLRFVRHMPAAQGARHVPNSIDQVPTGRIVSAFLTDVTPVTPFATSVAWSTWPCSGTVPCRTMAPSLARTVMLATLMFLSLASAERTLRESARLAARAFLSSAFDCLTLALAASVAGAVAAGAAAGALAASYA